MEDVYVQNLGDILIRGCQSLVILTLDDGLPPCIPLFALVSHW